MLIITILTNKRFHIVVRYNTFKVLCIFDILHVDLNKNNILLKYKMAFYGFYELFFLFIFFLIVSFVLKKLSFTVMTYLESIHE